jgi:hypothetical protein
VHFVSIPQQHEIIVIYQFAKSGIDLITINMGYESQEGGGELNDVAKCPGPKVKLCCCGEVAF